MLRQQFWTVKAEMKESCNQEEKHCGLWWVEEAIVQKYMNLCKPLKQKADMRQRAGDISLACGVREGWS